jgi:competence protein ComEC
MLKVWSPAGLAILQLSSPWSLARSSWAFHERFRAFWDQRLPESESSLLLGMTVGARGLLPANVKEACIRAGVYHIVVVSGQNMSLIVQLAVSALLLFQVPRRHALWVCTVPIIFYSTAVGGDPPVLRAAVTAWVGLLAAALRRDIPRFYPLLFAAGWILMWEPRALFGASFQLSFGATLSILAFQPIWNRGGRGRAAWKRWLQEAGLMGLCVHIGIWPILIYYFHRLSFAGFLANWTIFPLSGLVMVLGLAVGTWGVIAPATVPAAIVTVIGWIVHMTWRLILKLAACRWAVRPLQPPAVWVCGLYYGILFGILFLLYRRKIYAETHPTSRSRL